MSLTFLWEFFCEEKEEGEKDVAAEHDEGVCLLAERIDEYR